jgi:TonB family protein
MGSTTTEPVKEDEILWLENPPQTPPEAPKTESVSPPQPKEIPQAPVTPIPLAVPAPAMEPNPAPTFGLDDAVETGGLAVATGATLAKKPEPVVRVPEPVAGPIVLEAVPASTNSVVPRYPPRAEAMGLESKVVALVTTDTSGNVVDFRIERSGGRDFDESVRRAALATRFTVPVRDGRARAVAFSLPYSFRLD